MTSDSSVGSTRVAEALWSDAPSEARPYERTILLGTGDAQWLRATRAVLVWDVKTRSGFTVLPRAGNGVNVIEGADYTLVAKIGPLRIREPVQGTQLRVKKRSSSTAAPTDVSGSPCDR